MLKSTLVYILAAAIGQGVYFVIAPLVMQYFGDEVYAETEMFYVYSQFLFYFIGLNINSSIVRYKFEENVDSKAFNSSIITFGLLATLSLILILTPLAEVVSDLLSLPSEVVLLLPLGFFVFFSNTWVQQVYVSLKRKELYALYQFLLGVAKVSALLIVIFIIQHTTTFNKVFAENLLVLLVLIPFVLKEVRRTKKFKEHIRYAVLFAGPLVLYVLGNNVLNFSDQYILERILGKAELSVYSYSYRYAFILIIFFTSISNFFTIDYYENIENEVKAKKNQSHFTTFLTLFAFGLILMKSVFIELTTPWSEERVDYSASIADIVILGYFVHTYFLLWSRDLFYFKKNLALGVIVLISALCNIILNLWIIPSYGAIGASYTTLVSFLIIYLSTVIYDLSKSRFREGLYLRKRHFILTVLLSLICSIV